MSFNYLAPSSPGVTRYAELGGSWKSEVNKGNHVSINPIVFTSDKNIFVLKICIYQIYMTKKACAVVIKFGIPLIRCKNKFKLAILFFQCDFERKPFNL